MRAIEISKVVDVDRAADVAAAESLTALRSPSAQSCSAKQRSAAQHERPAPSARCWGIYRELAHSPGRETDDAEILRATGRFLSERGFSVELKSPDELPESEDAAGVPPFLFVMCERAEVVRRLSAWERRGVRIVRLPTAPR